MKPPTYYIVSIALLLIICHQRQAFAQCCVDGACGDIIYVDKLATGIGDGSNWTDAMNDLASAISATTTDDEIWVAAGTYVPGTDPGVSFNLPDGVGIIGGFFATPSSEGDCRERDPDPTTNSTVLSGQGGLNLIVVSNLSQEAQTELIGFTITEAGDVAIQNGLNSRATYQDLLVADNGSVNTTLAGGMNNLADSAIIVENCSFLRNSSPALGGAVQNEQSEARFTNCRFNDNSAVMEGGGIYSFENSIVTIEGLSIPAKRSRSARWWCVQPEVERDHPRLPFPTE